MSWESFLDGDVLKHRITLRGSQNVEWPAYANVVGQDEGIGIVIAADKAVELHRLLSTHGAMPQLSLVSDLQCPSCLSKKRQVPWSPPRRVPSGQKMVKMHCEECGIFYNLNLKGGK